MEKWRQNLTAILLMFSSVLIDGFIANNFTSTLDTSLGLVVPRTIVLMIIILSFHYKEGFMMGSAAAFGFIMDSYYLGFLGVYMPSLVLVAYLTYSLKRVIHPNVLSYTLIGILGITLVEIIAYGIMRILAITTIPIQYFIVSRLSATLLFNGIVMFLFSYFIHLLIVNIIEESQLR